MGECSNLFFATDSDCVGISALDFFSFAHILWGIIFFVGFSILYVIPKMKNKAPILSLRMCWILTVIFMGVVWELFENTVWYWLGFKFEGRRDSLLNIITDIIIVAIGAGLSWRMAYLLFEKKAIEYAYFVYGGYIILLLIVIYLTLRYLTLFNF